jgi:hypothetical protein
MNSAERVYAMLGNETLWDVARECHEVLQQAGIPHLVVGGVAVCLHGYQRNTVGLDIVLRPEDTSRTRVALTEAGFDWDDEQNEFRSSAGIPVQFLLAGERAGKGSELLLPDPGDEAAKVDLEGLPVVALAKLIELKIACGEGNLRRTHKDFADVVELVAAQGLRRDFARYLHKSLRKIYRELVLRARGE